jgi:hypothetical protein
LTQHDRGNDAGLIDELLLSLQPDQ